MKPRLWYPQLDVYDACRRILLLLASVEEPIPTERLLIADFFLANPPLLHRCTFSKDARSNFLAIGIPQPKKCFLHFPESQVLFSQMFPLQKRALAETCGRGLSSMRSRGISEAEITQEGLAFIEDNEIKFAMHSESAVAAFLSENMVLPRTIGLQALRKSTGLGRPL